MKVADLMTKTVATLTPGHSVGHAAAIMLEQRVSGLPVVDAGELVGLLTEGDLLRRTEFGFPKSASEKWNAANSPEGSARDFVKTHSWQVGDVMSKSVVTATEDMELSEVASIMATRGIKRLPVTRDGRLVGIISRADLLHIIAATPHESMAMGDEAIRISVCARLREADAVLSAQPAVTVENGVVHVWGTVPSEAQRDVIRVAVERAPGIRGFEDHMSLFRAATGKS